MSPRESILVVDDEPGICRLLKTVLGDAGFRVSAHENPSEALKAFDREKFDLVISDVRMPKLTGVDVLKSVKAKAPGTAVVLITAFGSTKTAVEAMKLGTSDFLTKPFRNEEIRLVVEGVLERKRLAAENAALRAELSARDGFGSLVGASPAMRDAFRQLARAAEGDEPVLIVGEPGTGKTAAARELHLAGRRAAMPLVVLDCGSLTERDGEAALWTRLADCRGGTAVLEEVSALPASGQSALMRVLLEGKLGRPGALEPVRFTGRLVATSSWPLEQPSARGAFRPDLLRRLCVDTIRLPALRERREDIEALARLFLERAPRRGARPLALTGEALDSLAARDWPGNVAELERETLRLARGEDGPVHGALKPFRDAKRELIDRFERGYLRRLMKVAEGNVSRAADIAGMDRKNLYGLLKKHGVAPRA